jgi:hypothetical protein
MGEARFAVAGGTPALRLLNLDYLVIMAVGMNFLIEAG